MARKTVGKVQGAVSGGATGGDAGKLAAAVALERLAARIRREAEGSLPPGAYTVDLAVACRGDITVAEPVEVAAKDKIDVTDRQLVIAMLAGSGRKQIESALGSALKLIATARDEGKPKLSASARADLDVAESLYDELLDKAARKARLVRQVPPTTRAGATGGQPVGRVEGSVTVGTTDVAIDVQVED